MPQKVTLDVTQRIDWAEIEKKGFLVSRLFTAVDQIKDCSDVDQDGMMEMVRSGRTLNLI